MLNVSKSLFGEIEDEQVWLYTLRNAQDMVVKIINYGGIITSCLVPDKDGKMSDVVLGFNDLEGYLGDHPYFGAIVGRYANRIGGSKFVLNDVEYKVTQNEGENHLHGGNRHFGNVIWAIEEVKSNSSVGVKLSYVSKDGEEGYPGNLTTTVMYQLNNDNELSIEYEAVTDKSTVVNLTNHSYFNLKGEGTDTVLNHEVEINSRQYTIVSDNLIPTGELCPVTDTPLDFRSPKKIGEQIDQVNQGYDHNYVLEKSAKELKFAARVFEPESKRVLEVFTTAPGMQFFTASNLDGRITGKSGQPYEKYTAFCLETQDFPDSPNQPEFPSTTLNPGEVYRHKTIFKFSVSKS